MPQNTPMKRQFTTIDGRTVMSNLPQHWGGNDWKITGVDNPLPVGNYVQTDSGVWIPQKGSVDGAADVRLTGSIVELKSIYTNTTITQGSKLPILTGENLISLGFKKIIVVARVSGNKAIIRADWRLPENTTMHMRRVDNEVTVSGYGHDFTMSVLSDYLNLEMLNNESSDLTLLRLMVIGVR